MNEALFRARLADIQGLLTQDLTDDQRLILGAELHVYTEAILDHFKRTGKMYRRAE